MTDTTLPETGTDNSPLPIPPLVVPKLRPKFKIVHSDTTTASKCLAKGIATIEDAVRVAWALAVVRNSGYVHVWAEMRMQLRPNHKYSTKENKIVASFSCRIEGRGTSTIESEIDYARRSLNDWANEFGRQRQRIIWIDRYGGFWSDRVCLLTNDQAFRVALGKNDFAAAAARADELERQVAA